MSEHTHTYQVTETRQPYGPPRPSDGAQAYLICEVGKCDCGDSWNKQVGMEMGS